MCLDVRLRFDHITFRGTLNVKMQKLQYVASCIRMFGANMSSFERVPNQLKIMYYVKGNSFMLNQLILVQVIGVIIN